jgi:branched-chain amino acid transport system ATP-binding protein
MSILKLENVSKNFGGIRAVDDLSLEIDQGKLTALIGPNGSGKTTLFNLISGITRATDGRILFEEKEIGDLPPHRIVRMGIARTFQNIRLFNGLSVIENVMLGRHSRSKAGLFSALTRKRSALREHQETMDSAMALLEFVRLSGHAFELAVNLPYGKKRLVEIARALASQPKLLLLDEPAAGMNETETGSLKEIIQAIHSKERVAVFIVEHDMKLVMGIADWICVLDHGAKICEGEACDVRDDSRVIEAYLGKETAACLG